MIIHKFSGAGNDFVVLDGRVGDCSIYRHADLVGALCREYSTDGLMILTEDAPGVDFTMEFYNPDGSGGMMCGNGGRCITAFAEWLGIIPYEENKYTFMAPDGIHTGEILSRDGLGKWSVRIRMIAVDGVTAYDGGDCFLNTGTRHLVRFTDDVEAVDMKKEAEPLRWDARFAPEGTNVNFVSVMPDGLHVRTFEKGVEGETLACGTGITASAIAAFHRGIPPAEDHGGRVRYDLRARTAWLSVDFLPAGPEAFRDIHLTGPAEMLF